MMTVFLQDVCKQLLSMNNESLFISTTKFESSCADSKDSILQDVCNQLLSMNNENSFIFTTKFEISCANSGNSI